MAKEEKEQSFFQKLWKSNRGKAGIKLGLWVIFFCFIGVYALLSPSPKSSSETSMPEEKTSFPSFKEMWNDLEKSNFKYEYEVSEKNSDDITTYHGEVFGENETGIKESKIGRIEYKKVAEEYYQVLEGEERKLVNFYDEIDIKYLVLNNLKKLFNTLTMSEETAGKTRTIRYQNETETIFITTDEKKITKIKVETMEKIYRMNYTQNVE